MTVDNDFPAPDLDEIREETLTPGLLRFVVGVAARAPSVHNTQPWRFVGLADGVELYADRSRQLPVVDASGRQLHISAGAAVHHARLALHGIGRNTKVSLRPSGSKDDLLARIRSEPSPDHPTPGDWALLQATQDRHTHRFPFRPGRLPRQILVDLMSAVDAHDVHARLIEMPGERRALARIVREATARQESDPAYRREMAVWTARPRSSRDGVPMSAASPVRQDEFRQRDFSRGSAQDWSPDIQPEEPDLVLLWTDNDKPEDWLRTGEALSSLLLSATCAGVGASLLNQPLEVPALRETARRELRLPGYPQLLLRLGFAAKATPTGRRRVEDVLDPK